MTKDPESEKAYDDELASEAFRKELAAHHNCGKGVGLRKQTPDTGTAETP
jgi:hypothetical protein